MTAPATAERRPPLTLASAMSLSASDGVLQADGTIWSHAATLGMRTKGTQFTIDRKTVENFIRVFTTGYPQKVPVDYDHALTTNDPEVRRARAMGKVPKAGDVLEMQGVFSVTDFTGALKTAAEKLAANAGRALDDPRNLGLWIRWHPTAKALAAIQAREYSELSITFDDDWPDNVEGKGQGPTILAVALTNLPFLDDMLPVAANRHGHLPAAPATPSSEDHMTQRQINLVSAVAALCAKPVTDEEQAVTELTAITPEITGLRSFRVEIANAIGETDPAKAIAAVKQLKAENVRLAAEAETAKKARIDGEIEATFKKYESRITPALRHLMAPQLRAELEKGVELAKTETVKALESMKELKITGQESGGDLGGANADDDVKLDAKARELMGSNPRIKSLAAKDEHEAYKEALVLAQRELRLVTA